MKQYILHISFSFLLIFASCDRVNAQQNSLFWGFALEGNPITTTTLKKVELETGLKAQLVLFFLQWPISPETNNFPLESLESIWNNGSVPCITWEPMFYENGNEIMIPYHQIIEGKYDDYLRSFAKKAKLWNKPFIIRFAHEMNIQRYHWGTEKAGYNSKSPTIYKKMFQYVVSFFKQHKVNNILWAFCPNAESVPNTSYDADATWNKIINYYPGDRYVDILGMDGYNWGTSRTVEKHGWKSNWKSFEEIFSSSYKELKKLSTKKPLFVFETSTVDTGGNKEDWIYNAFSTIQKMDIQGLIWFQAKKEEDWRINSVKTKAYIKIIQPIISASQQWIIKFSEKSR